jgi:protein ImuB
MVRRIYVRPVALPHRPRHEEGGWQLRGREDAPAERVLGPYVVEGGWWTSGASVTSGASDHPAAAHRSSAHRAYHFIRTVKGEWLWTFFDETRRRWFLQGRVE